MPPLPSLLPERRARHAPVELGRVAVLGDDLDEREREVAPARVAGEVRALGGALVSASLRLCVR